LSRGVIVKNLEVTCHCEEHIRFAQYKLRDVAISIQDLVKFSGLLRPDYIGARNDTYIIL
jgi:hypothetical protein